jgi:acetolactate synthase-1/3 small subunit
MLTTVAVDASNRGQVTELAAIFEAKILDVGTEALTLMVAGTPEKLDSVEELLRPFRITGLQRTGRIALPRIPRGTVRLAAVTESA